MIALTPADPAQAQEPRVAKWQVEVDLVDGSRVIGIPTRESFEVTAAFGQTSIPLGRIIVATWQEAGRIWRLELENDDILTASPRENSLGVTTLFGEVHIKLEHVESLRVWPLNGGADLPFDKDLVLSYDFMRIVRDAIRNQVSPEHAAVVKEARLTREGWRGRAVEFSGRSRLEVPHHEELCPAELTLSAWIRPEGAQGSYQIIVAKTNPSSWQGGYGLVRMPGDTKNVYFFINGYTAAVTKAEVPNDRWSHVAGVCDGRTVTLYVDGREKSSVHLRNPRRPRHLNGPVPAEDAAAGGIQHCDSALWIGSDSSGYAWTGKLDELALYKRALSPKEVALLAHVPGEGSTR